LIVLFLSFLAGFLLYQYAVTRNKRRLLSINQQMIMIQMNSHFVFNALTAIQSLIYKNKIEAAIYNLTLFSNLLNRIIAISLQQKISLQAELSFIEEFLLIQKLRFGNHLQFKIDIAEEVDVDRLRLPPLLLYPFLEYAAEECIQQVSEKTLILIRISQDHGFLIYEMIDLGLGFSNLELCYIKRYGGQKILCEDFTLERISLHNRFLKTKLIFAKNKYEYLGKEYSALQFKIKL